MLTLESFEEASEIVKQVTQETKLIYSAYFSHQTGNKVYLKAGKYAVHRRVQSPWRVLQDQHPCSEEEREKGLITASAGNHAQGVAYAAKKFGAKCSHRYADDHTADQGKPYQGLRRRSDPVRRCV